MADLQPLIKIAPTKAEKEAQKAHEKQVAYLSSEEFKTNSASGTRNYVSKRNEDYFIGGPLDGHTCGHQPNGPTHEWDPDRYWADYYIKESMRLKTWARKASGYHIYSSARALEFSLLGKAEKHASHRQKPCLNLGTRGPNMRKNYYYCGFMEEGLLALDGVAIDTFTGILTLS